MIAPASAITLVAKRLARGLRKMTGISAKTQSIMESENSTHFEQMIAVIVQKSFVYLVQISSWQTPQLE